METIIFLCNGEAEYYSGKGIIKNSELPGLIKSEISVHISPILQTTEYRTIKGIKLRVPEDKMYHPKQEYLKQRFDQCKWCSTI